MRLHCLRLLFAIGLVTPCLYAASQGESRPARAFVWDNKTGLLRVVNPDSGQSLRPQTLPAGMLFVPRDQTRLVVIWDEPRTRLSRATVLDRATLRVVGETALGCRVIARYQLIESGSHLAIGCWEPSPGRGQRQRRRVVSLDLSRAALSGSANLDVASQSFLDLGDGRVVLAPSGDETERPTAVVLRLPDLASPLHVPLPCAGRIDWRVFGISDGRRGQAAKLIALCTPSSVDEATLKLPAAMMIVDTEASGPPKTVRLGSGVWSSFADRDFVYAIGQDEPSDTGRTLAIYSVEEEAIRERIPVARDAAPLPQWPPASAPRARGESPYLVISGDSLLTVTRGRVSAPIPLPGSRAPFASVVERPDLGRLFVLRERSLVTAAMPTGDHLWTTTVPSDGSLSVSPDGKYGLVISGDDVTIVDLGDGRLLGKLTTSTGGVRTARVLKDLGASALAGSPVNSSQRPNVVFGRGEQPSLVLAQTGEVSVVDLRQARLMERLKERASAIVPLPDSSLALLLSPGRATVFDLAANAVVRALTFDDAPSGELPSMALSSDQTTFAVGSGATLYFLDARTGQPKSKADRFRSVSSITFLD